MRLETIPLSLLILLSVLVITEQEANAQVTYDSSKQNPDRMGAQRLQKSLLPLNLYLQSYCYLGYGKNFTQDEPVIYSSSHTRSSSCSFVNTYLFLLYLSLLLHHVECHTPLGCRSCFLSLCVCSSGGYTSQSRSHSTSRRCTSHY
jgi:hypothetical protein